MKKLLFLVMASALMFACSQSDEPEPAVDNNVPDGSVIFDVSAVNNLNIGNAARGNIYSQEATQHVTNVMIHAFMNNGSDYVYSRSYTISGWSDGTTFKSYEVGDSEKLPQGNYMFLAIGRDASDNYTVTTPGVGTTYSSMLASVQSSGQETEIFAGSVQAQIASKGSRVSIPMTRKVAGVLGYFKNVPQSLNSVPVKYLRLTVTNSNQQVNLTNGVGINTAPTSFNIIDMDLSTQATSNGVYTGNDLSAQGVVKVPNSQLSGSFLIPVSGVKLTLALYDASNNVLQSWVVKDASNNNSDTFNITANHFYSLGMKKQAGNVNGGTDDPGDDDNPIDLLIDQNIVVTISPAWEMMHDLVIQ